MHTQTLPGHSHHALQRMCPRGMAHCQTELCLPLIAGVTAHLMHAARIVDTELLLVTDVGPAVVRRLPLVALLLCSRCVPGDQEISGTEVFMTGNTDRDVFPVSVRKIWTCYWALEGSWWCGSHHTSPANWISIQKHLCLLIFIVTFLSNTWFPYAIQASPEHRILLPLFPECSDEKDLPLSPADSSFL